MRVILVALLLGAAAEADEIILKNGKKIPFRVLSDGVDVVRVQTVDNQTLEIPKKDVRGVRFEVPKAPLTGATFTDDDTVAAEKPVNLLARIDPKKHGVIGEWRFTRGALEGKGGLLEAPWIPASSSYDVEVVVERRESKGTMHIGLAAEGRSFAFVLDWGDGQASGLSVISGRKVFENPTRINGEQLPLRKPRHIVCAVRPGRVVVMLDKKPVVDWKGDLTRLSHYARPKNEANLWFITQGSFAVHRYVVTERRPK